MRIIKIVLAFGGAILSLLYLANAGAGIIEFIPDNIPIAGNLDEVFATLVLIKCLALLGLDVKRLVGGSSNTIAKEVIGGLDN